MKEWGNNDADMSTDWKVLGGPVIGFHLTGFVTGNEGTNTDMSIIVGDRCRPKYFGARKLLLKLGEKREVQFAW